jgi:hypothetical protein
MRKVLMLFLAAALVLAFSWPAQAAGKYLGAPDFKFRGWYAAWGTTNHNVLDFDDDIHDRGNFVFTRFRWWFDTSFEGKYGGTIGFEYNWFWGQDAASTAYVDTLNAMVINTGFQGGHGDDLVDIERLRHAYFWFMVPHTPVKMTVGLQSMIIEPDIIMHGSNAVWWGIRGDVPIIKGLLNVSVAWMKQDEGANDPFALGTVDARVQNSDDSDYWWINITGALAKWLTYGTYHEWLHVRHNGYTSLDAGAGFRGLGAFSDWALATGLPRANLDAFEGDYFWHGLHLSARFPWWYARLHGNYFWGDMEDRYASLDVEPSGWAFVGRAGLTFGPFEIGLKGWYFSGNDSDKDDPTDPEWDRWASPDAFFTGGAMEILYTGARQWAFGGGYVSSGVPGGSAFLGLESDWQVTKKLLLDLLAGYAWATKHRDKATQYYFNPLDGSKNDDNGLASRSTFGPRTRSTTT